MNRGSQGADAGRVQRARRFNEAPIHESGKCIVLRPAARPDMASMRPRFMNRGSRSEQIDYLRHLHASMRPRFMNRGSGNRALGRHREQQSLQ